MDSIKDISSKFCVGSWVRQTSEEGRRLYQLKRGNNNKDEDNSLKTLNDKKPEDIFILMKTRHGVHMFWVITSNGNIIPPFIFPPMASNSTEAYIKCLKELYLPRIKKVAVGRPYFKNKTLHYTKQRGEPSLGHQNISATTSPLIPQTAIPLIVMCKAWSSLWERYEPPHSSSYELNSISFDIFTRIVFTSNIPQRLICN